jgi:translation initiation factor IF-2
LNKIDLPGIDEQRILQQLAQHEILPAEWGGEYEVVRTSGATGKGVDKLLETLILTAELHELKANPERESLGVCLESFRDEGRGAIAWLIVQKGTLRVGDIVLCGSTYGRIRAMYNDRDEPINEAGPSVPVKVSGLMDVPGAGDHFFVMKDIEEARETAETRLQEGRRESLAQRVTPRTLEDILNQPRAGEGVQELPLILKADSPGSIEALRSEIGKFEHPEVRVQIIHYGIGGVNESDVYLASAAGAIIIAFHVIAEERAQLLAEREGVEIRRYNIIYEVTDHIRLALQGLLRPERVEVSTGRAIVLRTFSISRFGTIAGCRVLNGTIARDSRVHLIRDQKVLNDYKIGSLKREKDDAKEVREGMECGIRLEGFNDVKEGDLLEAFRIDEIKRTLS